MLPGVVTTEGLPKTWLGASCRACWKPAKTPCWQRAGGLLGACQEPAESLLGAACWKPARGPAGSLLQGAWRAAGNVLRY